MTLSKTILDNWEYNLNFVLDSTYNGVIAVDKDGYIVSVNKSALKMLDSNENLMGKYIQEIIPDSHLPFVLQTGKAELGQKVNISERVCLANLTPILRGNEIMGAVVVFEDVLILRQMVEDMSSLKELRQVTQALLESVLEGAVIIDKVGIIEGCNDAFCQFINSDKEKVTGKYIADVLPELDLTGVFESVENEYVERRSIKGQDVIVTNLPIFNGSEVVGAVGKIMFKPVSEMDVLVNKVKTLKSKIAFYSERLEAASGAKFTKENIVGKSQAISMLKESILKHAPGNTPILLRGEQGTGKQLFAHAIHRESNRKFGPFVHINCSEFPDNLLEVELFGAVAGVMGRTKKNDLVGKFEICDRGTLFLNEIDQMSPAIQERLMQVLRDKTIQRTGEDIVRAVDVRLVAATSSNLEDLIGLKLFREDLYYQLNVLCLNIPPLRERQEDMELLTNNIIEKYNREFGKKVTGISSEVYRILIKHAWPGNIRELERVLSYSFDFIEEELIQVHHLPAYLKKAVTNETKKNKKTTLKFILDETERNTIMQAIQQNGGNKVKAAQQLGISRASLYQKLEKFNLLNE
ncbi:MAG: sigma 54-interacting transcriptional regulator [Thermincola sp.]|nr:sigma 54-interacting transcriptional regulator [Thermincola sp.]MDT3701473.1 sigma 54-interacting transcriptional regulator [Thermincola sp.]